MTRNALVKQLVRIQDNKRYQKLPVKTIRKYVNSPEIRRALEYCRFYYGWYRFFQGQTAFSRALNRGLLIFGVTVFAAALMVAKKEQWLYVVGVFLMMKVYLVYCPIFADMCSDVINSEIDRIKAAIEDSA
jgi:hypothetical protein